MRQPTLETMGLGPVIDIFKNGRLPADAAGLVDKVFGDAPDRGSLVISGANGIVGAGKAMQLGSRLSPFNVPVVALDFPGVPDGIGKQYPGLVRAFGADGASQIMKNVISLTYDGKTLPASLGNYNPRFLLEAIPEILQIKKAHFELFKKSFPEIEIRSVTSGFPAKELGVGIAHPAFPHEINKIWEIVEDEPSDITRMFWALGMIPVPVSDDWSFVLDVQFCGLTLTGLKYHSVSNMPFWKIDKLVRKLLGPNPFRAHDVIGAAGANFLTWSCLHHLSKHYGDVFAPTAELVERKDSGMNWYPLNHFRPVCNWTLDEAEERAFETWILGPMCQMASLLLKENRGHLTHINAVGELCAQFTKGILARIRSMGPDETVNTVNRYHALFPEAGRKGWFPEVFDRMEEPGWQQLYVNAEHDGKVGVITLARESYNSDVDAEMNRAIDWLRKEGVERVILTGDFHLTTQLVGADTNEFFPALEDEAKGFDVAHTWSRTARRLNDEFKVSVGFINGKRCLGGMLELMVHCHYVVSVHDVDLGLPEVTLPVVPGMEGCHWTFRKAKADQWPELFKLLLNGRPVKADNAVGWLVDYAGSLDDAIAAAWKIAEGGDHGLKQRPLEQGALKGLPGDPGVSPSGDPSMEAARKAIFDNVIQSCTATLADAVEVQARHSAGFMTSKPCRKGAIGSMASKIG
jgi:enoyl-CoA hydratase/carnithine racemase/3-hydroxyacyl-CoA dehydrogenase